MTDLEMTRLCAEAMGLENYSPYSYADSPALYRQETVDPEGAVSFYDPLHDDAQAMALLFYLVQKGVVTVSSFGFKFRLDVDENPFICHKIESLEILRRAMVECVARMQKERT